MQLGVIADAFRAGRGGPREGLRRHLAEPRRPGLALRQRKPSARRARPPPVRLARSGQNGEPGAPCRGIEPVAHPVNQRIRHRTLLRTLTTPHKLQGRGEVGKPFPGTVRPCLGRRQATAAPCQLHAVVRLRRDRHPPARRAISAAWYGQCDHSRRFKHSRSSVSRARQASRNCAKEASAGPPLVSGVMVSSSTVTAGSST